MSEEGGVGGEDDPRALDRFDGAAHLVGSGIRGNADGDVAHDARLGNRVHIDGADRSSCVANDVSQESKGAGLVRHIDP